MAKHLRSGLLHLSILFILAFSLLHATPARADDGTTTAPGDAPTEVAPDSASTTDSSATASSSDPGGTTSTSDATLTTSDTGDTTSTSTDVASTDAAPTDATLTDPSASDTSTSDVTSTDVLSTTDSATDLSQLPADTTVMVLDSSGQSVPLGTQAAVDVIATGDPMWCPAGVTPGGAGCTINYATFALLLADPIFTAGGGVGPAVNGVIWIRDTYAGADSAAITFDGNTLSTMKNFTLTLKGGWTGVGTTIDTLTPSLFDEPLSIINWQADVTLSNIEIVGAGGSAALTVTTTKNITLTNMHVHDNTGGGEEGANLSNSTGTGNVTVSSSEFYGNNDTNLDVSSDGVITLTNVLAIGSTNGYGALLDNSGAASALPISVTGDGLYHIFNTAFGSSIAAINNSFNDNAQTGLDIQSKGLITLGNPTASGNGTALGSEGSGVQIFNAGGTGGVTLTGTNVFTDNYRYGLNLESKGAVTLNNVTANSNGDTGIEGYGVYINNSSAGSAMAVTLTGTNQFKYNSSTGLGISSKGLVTLNNVTATYNGLLSTPSNGLAINNDFLGFSSGVTLTGTNVLSHNGGTGLLITSRGIVSLNNITASSNGTVGVSISNNNAATALPVKLAGINVLSSNQGTGLYIRSKGLVTINSLTAEHNGLGGSGYGIDLDNSGAGLVGLTMTGTNALNDDYSGGLNAITRGPVSISNLTASDSAAGVGAWISNTASGTGSPQNVTLTGTNVFNDNAGNGLEITTYGTITLSSVTAGGNHNGAYLINNGGLPALPRPITLSGTNTFNSNDFYGLFANSLGLITVNNLTANGNGLVGSSDGAWLDTHFTGSLGGVKLTGSSTLNSNYSFGLRITSNGAVTLNSITAHLNGFLINAGGVLIDNHLTGTAGVTLTGINNFGNSLLDSNQWTGLYVLSNGAIAISNVTSNGSHTGSGAFLDNHTASIGGPAITLYGLNTFNSNFVTGISLNSRGAVNLYVTGSMTANNNVSSYGIDLNNTYAPLLHSAVKLLGSVTATGNPVRGISIASAGAVTVHNATAGATIGGDGAYIDNTASTTASPQNVSLTGTNAFSNNTSGYGLTINTFGAIALNSVTAANNNIGALLDNHLAAALLPRNVTLTGVNNFNSNQLDGLDVNSRGLISASSLTASNNGQGSVSGSGAVLFNQYSGVTGGVKLLGINTFKSNWNSGLTINSNGAVSLNSITASSNGGLGHVGSGATVNNVPLSGTAQLVTLTGTNVFGTAGNGNYSGGLYVQSAGTITASSLSATDTANGTGVTLTNGSGSSVAGVTLTGIDTFNGNYTTGLDIFSFGPISILTTRLTANNNGVSSGSGSGLVAYNLTAVLPKPIKLAGVNTFSGNYNAGLQLDSKGAITVANVNASETVNDSGANITNTTNGQGVILSGTNTFHNNYAHGLNVSSKGAITLNSVTANSNDSGFGVNADNDSAGVSPFPGITLTGTNTFSENASGGISLSSKGPIKVSNLQASHNHFVGATLSNTSGGATAGVTLTGVASFLSNDQTGLFIQSNGPILVSTTSLSASENGIVDTNGSGVFIFGAGQPVTLNGVNTFVHNFSTGLTVTTAGAITVSNLTISSTANGDGAYLDNTSNTSGAGAILKVSGTNKFTDNYNSGLNITANGAISLNNITANNNGIAGFGGWGADVNNASSTSVQPLTLTGINSFNGNYTGGLQAQSKGQINGSNVTANTNGHGGATGYGALFNVNGGGATGGVTLTGLNVFSNNIGYGAFIQAVGPVRLGKVTADGNDASGSGDGLYIDTTSTVTLMCGTTANNAGAGIRVLNASSLSLLGMVSSGNPGGNLVYTGPLTQSITCPLP